MFETTFKNLTVETLDEIKLVGFRVLCARDQYIQEIPKASKRLSERVFEIKHVLNPTVQYGAFVVTSHTEENDGYWVCTQVKEFEDIPTDMIALTIPTQTYAIWKHKGPNVQILSAYRSLHKWIEENNYKRLTDRWHLEKFISWHDITNVEVELFDTVEQVKMR